MTTQISLINQTIAKKSLPPYDKVMHPKGPKIVDDTPGKVVIFDGWQNLPPQNLDAKTALENAFTRSICIQNAQIRNRVMFYSSGLKQHMRIATVINPFVLRAEEQRKKELKARKELDFDVDTLIIAEEEED
jgi:hypothetical protein